MSYQALYRKFRPATFEDVKGQDAIITTLQNQLKAGRVGHAYLFCGTRGTGKTTIAKILARAVNCENPQDGNPCGVCRMCQAIGAGVSMNVIEMDAASNNGVDDVRRIVEEVSYSPAEGRYKVYIIDEVHMLSNSAFNALLKTLEEPPAYVIFILATTEANRIPITVLSRCQRYDFKRISIDTITDRLRELMEKEGVSVEEKALRYVARMADGSMRDGLSLLDQCIAFHYGETLTYDMALDVLGSVDSEVFGRLFRACVSEDVTAALLVIHEIVMQGRELVQFVADLIWYLRSLLLLQVSDNIEDVVDVSSDNLAMMKEEAKLAEGDVLMRYIRIFSELQGQLRYATAKRVLIEMALIKICRPQMEAQQDALLSRIRDMEEKLENGTFALAGETKAYAAGQENPHPTPQTTRQKQEKEKALAKALPEDIRMVAGRWGELCQMADMPMRLHLQHARLSVENDTLLLILPDDTSGDYFTDEDQPQRMQQLQDMISRRIGKEVTIQTRVVKRSENEEHIYPDLLRVVNLPIEEDTDESGPLD